MAGDYSHDVLTASGFERFGSLDHGFAATFWWHSQLRLEIALVPVGQWLLLRGTKHYRMTAIGTEGDLYTRDLAAFSAYLRGLFEEVHVLCSSFRDVTLSLARRRIREKGYRCVAGSNAAGSGPSADHYAELVGEFTDAQEELGRYDGLQRLDSGGSGLLQRYLRDRTQSARHRLGRVREQARTARDQVVAQKRLEKEYLGKSEATCLLFSCCSNVQLSESAHELNDAVAAVILLSA